MSDDRVEHYKAALSAMAGGRYDVSVDVVGAGPIADLGDLINELAEVLSERFLELQRSVVLAERVNLAMSLHDVLEAIFHNFRALLPFGLMAYAELDAEEERAQISWSRVCDGLPAVTTGGTVTIAMDLLDLAIQDARPHIHNDLANLTQRRSGESLATLLLGKGYGSCLVSPLLTRESRSSAIVFACVESHAYEASHLEALGRLVGQLALTVEKSRIHDELRSTKQALTKANRELERLAMLDGLTGIPNRRYLDLRLDQEWRRMLRERREISFLLIDVDHFKRFNDRFGHLAGDDCLRSIARVLSSNLRRAQDFVARYGGEEFACVLSGSGLEVAVEVAERIRRDIASLAIPNASTGDYVTVSAGIAFVKPAPVCGPSQLVKAADRALYAAKRRGRNRVVVVDLAGRLGPSINELTRQIATSQPRRH